MKIVRNSRFLIFIFLMYLSPLAAFAQQSVSEKIGAAHDSFLSNRDKARDIITSIKDDDVKDLPDSVRFDYHYVKGAFAFNENNYENAVVHLLATKKLCETSLGIKKAVYLEIMNSLGLTYDYLGKYEEALAIYQEGIVKGLAIRDWPGAKESFSEMNAGLASIYERRGWLSEVPGLWRDTWGFWNKTVTPFEPENIAPLQHLYQFYLRQSDYDKALDVIIETADFVSLYTDRYNPIWNSILFDKGVVLGKQGKYKEAADQYREAIKIAMINKDHGYLALIYGNLVCDLAEYEDTSIIDICLSEINQYCPERYAESLWAVSYIFEKRRLYNDALAYVRKAIPLVDGETKENYEWHAGKYESEAVNQENLNKLCAMTVPKKGSAEWFEYMEQLANIYYGDNQTDKAKSVLEEMVKETEGNKAYKDERVRLLDLMIGCAIDISDDATILLYADEWVNGAKKKFGEKSIAYFNSTNTVAVSCIKTNDTKRAKNLLDKITPLCIDLAGKESAQYATLLHNKGRVAQLSKEYESAKSFFEESLSIHTSIKTPENQMSRTRECLGEVELKLREQI